MLALSKADLVTPDDAEAARALWASRVDCPVLVTSSATAHGLDALASAMFAAVPLEPASASAELLAADDEALAEHVVFRPVSKRGFHVERVGDHEFKVVGEGIERLLARYDLDNEDAMGHVEGRLERLGVMRALAEQGFEAGDDVEIGGTVFEFDVGE